MIHTGRRALLSLEGSYHGKTLAGLSIGTSDNREQIKNLLPRCGKIAPPLDAKALRRIEQRLKRRDVAAFVMEPISINLGILIPEKDAIRQVRDLCRRYGTLFIADEVACGFGRTGRLFACEHFDLDPDMLCVAKAMSGGLAPIGAVIATAPIATSMEENAGAFYSTYGWHPRSVAAAIATLRDLKKNRSRLLAGVAEMSEYFRVRLPQLEFNRPAAVRIQGLTIGIDVGEGGVRGHHPRQVPAQWAARVDRRIDGAAAAVAGERQADRRERTGHSGALDMMRRGGLAANSMVPLGESPRVPYWSAYRLAA